MASAEVLSKLQQRALCAEQLIADLKAQLQSAQQTAVAKVCQAEQERVAAENAQLRQDIERLKQELASAEVRNGVKQVPIPSSRSSSDVRSVVVESKSAVVANGVTPQAEKPARQEKKKQASAEKKEQQTPAPKESKKQAEAKPVSTPAPSGGENVDVSRLNMRIGRIVDVKKHPDADSLYVEEVDVGESRNRSVVSGLVKHVPIEEMQNRVAVFLCNLKPAKMRGVMSEAMIMCASSPEKVEIIVPPSGVEIGERVIVDGYPGEPDEQLNPKKKTWEQIQPDLRINAEGLATYKGALWRIEGKGTFKAPTMVESAIK